MITHPAHIRQIQGSCRPQPDSRQQSDSQGSLSGHHPLSRHDGGADDGDGRSSDAPIANGRQGASGRHWTVEARDRE